jgi:hypothetical protein
MRQLRRGMGLLSVELPPADQSRYRDTARADTGAIRRQRPVVVVVGIITLAAAEATAFLAVQKLTGLEKAGLAALAAGVGAVLVLPIIYACALVGAPHRQQKWKAAKIAGLESEHASRERQERTEGQFAAAILAGDEITRFDEAGVPLVIAWLDATRDLVADTFGELQAARLAARRDVAARRARLDELAEELHTGDRHFPSESWVVHLVQVNAFYEALQDIIRAGADLRGDLIRKVPEVGRPQVDAWLNELEGVLDLMPGFGPLTCAAGAAGAIGWTYEGIDDDEINLAITLIDRRLPYLQRIVPPLRAYRAAVGP